MSGFKPQQAPQKRVQKRAPVARKAAKAKMTTKVKCTKAKAAGEALVAHQWGEAKLTDAQIQENVKIVQDSAQAVADSSTKGALTSKLLQAKFGKNKVAIAEAEAQLKAAGFSTDDIDAYEAGKSGDAAGAKFDQAATGLKLGQGVNAKRLPVYPALEPFADLETVRKTVEKYQDSFQLSANATPFGGLGQMIKKYGKLPFAFLALAALTSKGIYMVDPGTLITFNTSLVIFSYYAVGQQGIRESYREFVDTMNGRYQDGLQTSIAVYEAGISHCKASIDKPSIINDANVALQEAHDALTDARVRVQQQTHKDAILGKLNVVVGQEQAEAKAAAEKARASALNFLRSNALTDKVKDDVFNEALTLVGKKTGTGAPEFKALQSVLKDALAKAQ